MDGGKKNRTEEMVSALKQRGASFLATTDLVVIAPVFTTTKLAFLHRDLGQNWILAKLRNFRQFFADDFPGGNRQGLSGGPRFSPSNPLAAPTAGL
jgi:hypothetical protein